MEPDVLLARIDALRDALRDVLALVDPNGFMWPMDQEAVHRARALLAELNTSGSGG